MLILLHNFQAEIFAIMAIRESVLRGYKGRTITIFNDSQAALKALESVTVKSKLVLKCLGFLNELATHNSIQLVWVPEREGILGNERADELDPSPYLAYPIAWSNEQLGTGWRGNT